MKRYILIPIICLLSILNSEAQGRHRSRHDNPEWLKKLNTERIAYISNEVNLTSIEAEKFWPVYNEFKTKKEDAHFDLKKAYEALKTKNEVSETEMKNILEEFFDKREKLGELEEESAEEYLKILPASKVAKLFLAEENFRRRQINLLKGNHK